MAPSVRYLLGQDTLQFLRDHRESEGTLLLQNRYGIPLVVRDIRVNGKATTNDSIKNAYDRLKKKTGIEKPLKLLRKEAATDHQRLVTLAATGQMPFPDYLAAKDATELLMAVRRLRRTRSVQSIARALPKTFGENNGDDL